MVMDAWLDRRFCFVISEVGWLTRQGGLLRTVLGETYLFGSPLTGIHTASGSRIAAYPAHQQSVVIGCYRFDTLFMLSFCIQSPPTIRAPAKITSNAALKTALDLKKVDGPLQPYCAGVGGRQGGLNCVYRSAPSHAKQPVLFLLQQVFRPPVFYCYHKVNSFLRRGCSQGGGRRGSASFIGGIGFRL